VLKLIEWRYNLPPPTKRDASNEIANLALALNFNKPTILCLRFRS
jgi:phospholipase C